MEEIVFNLSLIITLIITVSLICALEFLSSRTKLTRCDVNKLKQQYNELVFRVEARMTRIENPPKFKNGDHVIERIPSYSTLKPRIGRVISSAYKDPLDTLKTYDVMSDDERDLWEIEEMRLKLVEEEQTKD